MTKMFTGLLTALALLGLCSGALAYEGSPPPPSLPPAPSSLSHHTMVDLPAPLLQEGLKTTTACATVEAYGIQRFLKFYEANKADTTSGDSIAGRAEAQAVDDFDQMEVDASLAAAMATALGDKGMKQDDVLTLVRDIALQAKNDLVAKYDQIEDFDEFDHAMQDATKGCTDSLHIFVGKVKSFVDNLDTRHPNH